MKLNLLLCFIAVFVSACVSNQLTYNSVGAAAISNLDPFYGPADKERTIQFYDETAVVFDLNNDGESEYLVNLNCYIEEEIGFVNMGGTDGVKSWVIIGKQNDRYHIIQHFDMAASPIVLKSKTNGWSDIVMVHKGPRDKKGIRYGQIECFRFNEKQYEQSHTKTICLEDGEFQQEYQSFITQVSAVRNPLENQRF